jgi:hypothetical protein
MHFSIKNFPESYFRIYQSISEKGERLSPRGKNCVELRPYYLTINNPLECIYVGKERGLNLKFMAVETLGYIAGLGGDLNDKWFVDLLCSTNRNYSNFVNDKGFMDGAYGNRLIKSLPQVCDLLKSDPDSRQAVASIWRPEFPNLPSKDVPCTVALNFFRSKGKLDLVTHMRSNDINWGTPYDIPAFVTIQALVASLCGLEVGRYHHSVGSMHYYEDTKPSLDPSIGRTDLKMSVPVLKLPNNHSIDYNTVSKFAKIFLWEMYVMWQREPKFYIEAILCRDDFPEELKDYFRIFGRMIEIGKIK